MSREASEGQSERGSARSLVRMDSSVSGRAKEKQDKLRALREARAARDAADSERRERERQAQEESQRRQRDAQERIAREEQQRKQREAEVARARAAEEEVRRAAAEEQRKLEAELQRRTAERERELLERQRAMAEAEERLRQRVRELEEEREALLERQREQEEELLAAQEAAAAAAAASAPGQQPGSSGAPGEGPGAGEPGARPAAVSVPRRPSSKATTPKSGGDKGDAAGPHSARSARSARSSRSAGGRDSEPGSTGAASSDDEDGDGRDAASRRAARRVASARTRIVPPIPVLTSDEAAQRAAEVKGDLASGRRGAVSEALASIRRANSSQQLQVQRTISLASMVQSVDDGTKWSAEEVARLEREGADRGPMWMIDRLFPSVVRTPEEMDAEYKRRDEAARKRREAEEAGIAAPAAAGAQEEGPSVEEIAARIFWKAKVLSFDDWWARFDQIMRAVVLFKGYLTAPGVVDPANRVSIALEAIRVWLERIAGTKEQAEQLFVLLRHGGPFPHLDAFLARLPQATAAVDRVLCEVGLVSEETAALFPRTAHTQRLCANILLDEEEEEMLRCHAGIALAHMGAAALQQHTQALERIAETVLPRPAPPAVRYAAYRCLLSLWTEAGVLKQKLAAADAEGRTMLMRGAQYGNAKMVAVLVDAGADVKLADRGGRTALHFAAGSGDATTIRVLLDAGADAQVRDEETLTPLMVAAASGHAEACRVLVEEGGAGVEDVDHSKATPLMLAAKGGHTEAIRALLALRAEVNVLDVAGRTPLMWAALSGRGSALNALLDAGADITVVDLDGYNAIIHAAERGHADALTSLLLTVDRQLAAGRAFVDFSINDQLPTGRNALMLAAAGGHKFAVRALIRARADPFITDGVLVGRTALDYAAANAHLEVATMLREYMDRRAVQEADDLAAIERDARADIRARETGGDRDADLGANVSFVRLVEHMWA